MNLLLKIAEFDSLAVSFLCVIFTADSLALIALLLMAKHGKKPEPKSYGYLQNDSCPINLKDIR